MSRIVVVRQGDDEIREETLILQDYLAKAEARGQGQEETERARRRALRKLRGGTGSRGAMQVLTTTMRTRARTQKTAILHPKTRETP